MEPAIALDRTRLPSGTAIPTSPRCLLGCGRTRADNESNIRWVRDYYDAVAPHSEEGGYIHFAADDDQRRAPANYDANYARLVEIKRKYDPDNVFHLNQNIKP